MKIAVVYRSTHHGNTKKVLEALSEHIEVFPVEKAGDLSEYDVLGFASGIYYGQPDKTLFKYIRQYPIPSKAFVLYTAGAVHVGQSRRLEKVLSDKGVRVLGVLGLPGWDTFGPFKLFGGFAKGHPNEDDFKKAKEWLEKILKD